MNGEVMKMLEDVSDLKEIVRSIIIAYDMGDLTSVEGLLNQAQELVK